MTIASAPGRSIRRQETERPDLLGFEIWGRIDKADMAWMAGQVQDAFAEADVIDVILVMHHYDGAELGAVFDLESLKAQARSVFNVRRYAVVGAPTWAEAMITLMSPLSPVEAQAFTLDDLDAAWRWVRGAE